jgi:hypothetical protein
MDKYEQITTLAAAAAMIQQVINSGQCLYSTYLQDINDDIADIADQIEES